MLTENEIIILKLEQEKLLDRIASLQQTGFEISSLIFGAKHCDLTEDKQDLAEIDREIGVLSARLAKIGTLLSYVGEF